MKRTKVKRIKKIVGDFIGLVGIIGIIALYVKLFSTANTNFIEGIRPLTTQEMLEGVEYTQTYK